MPAPKQKGLLRQAFLFWGFSLIEGEEMLAYRLHDVAYIEGLLENGVEQLGTLLRQMRLSPTHQDDGKVLQALTFT